MKLSVIVICYNQLEYIGEAVDSILNQNLNDYEIIIGDDGSDDGSYEYINDNYGGLPHVKIFRMDRAKEGEQRPYVRQCQIRIEALKYVEGEYFAFLDGDDFYCDKEGFQKKINVMELPANSDVSACGSNFWYYLNGEYTCKGVSERLREGRVTKKIYWRHYYTSASTFVFRSSMIGQLNYEVIEKMYNDNIILYCAMQFGNIYYINSATLSYRQEVRNSIWSLGKTRDKHIRQVMEIDMANRINNKMWKESYYRYRNSIKYLLKNKVVDENKELLSLMRELECKEALGLCGDTKRLSCKTIVKHFFLQRYCDIIWWKRYILSHTRFEKYVE